MLSSSSSLSDDDVADIAAQSTDPWNSDYSLYIQARLFDAAQRNQTIRLTADLLIFMSLPGMIPSRHSMVPPGMIPSRGTAWFIDSLELV